MKTISVCAAAAALTCFAVGQNQQIGAGKAAPKPKIAAAKANKAANAHHKNAAAVAVSKPTAKPVHPAPPSKQKNQMVAIAIEPHKAWDIHAQAPIAKKKDTVIEVTKVQPKSSMGFDWKTAQVPAATANCKVFVSGHGYVFFGCNQDACLAIDQLENHGFKVGAIQKVAKHPKTAKLTLPSKATRA